MPHTGVVTGTTQDENSGQGSGIGVDTNGVRLGWKGEDQGASGKREVPEGQ